MEWLEQGNPQSLARFVAFFKTNGYLEEAFFAYAVTSPDRT
jgi:hypothetical protein